MFQIKRDVKRNRWNVVSQDSEQVIAFSETYDGAVKAAKEIQSPFDDPLIKVRESEVNYELLGRIVTEKAKLRDTASA